VVEIARSAEPERGDQLRAQAAATVEAMRDGADVIYQATFFDGRWLGYADFLLRVDDAEQPSVWGAYHYEVSDTKLARHAKASALLQICSYVEQLTRIQKRHPERMHVALGGSARAVATFRVADYMAYYRTAVERFEEAVLGTAERPPPEPVYPLPMAPDPVEHCDVCRWSEVCTKQRRDEDHLSLVAGISARQRKALTQRGVATLAALGELALPMQPELEGTSASALEKVREQARIQFEHRRKGGALLYELFTPEPGEPIDPERGLAILPQPSDGDLFFDIEGDPYAFDDGLDYLFGVMDTSGDFTAIWSRDADGAVSLAGEKRAFEAFIDFVMGRRERHPDLHVYHYATYEPTALKRLMGRHATREAEVDQLLRGGVLVDLFRAVRQGLRASVESYSIKRLEPLYGFTREIDLRDAGSSIVAFEEWLQLGDEARARPEADHLERIEGYNRDDVVSTLRLRDWLEERRLELAQSTGQEVPRPVRREPEIEELTEADRRVTDLAERLTTGVSADPALRSPEEHGRWLLAQLLSWHRREDKAAWWEFFHLTDMTPEELVGEKDPIGALRLIGPVGEPYGKRKMRQAYRYEFPVQEFDIGSRADLYDPRLRQEDPAARHSAWKVRAELVAIDEVNHTIDLGWPADDEPRHPEALVPLNVVRTTDQRAALFRLGEWVADNGIDADGSSRAGRDLLLRRAPRCGQADGESLRLSGESDLDAACRLVTGLERSTLAIQGPPGSGKTFSGARMIVRLVADGKRVGISGTSHKVIGNLLSEVLEAAAADGTDVRAAQKVSDLTQGLVHDRVKLFKDGNDKLRAGVLDGDFNVAAGTSWLWAAPAAEGLVDVLFVDEAGQISLANVLAMSGAADSIVLLGDPQQLDQPLQGSHPPGADRSALAHLLGDAATMPPQLGLFLERTWRLHDDVCRFTSESFDESRLFPEPHLAVQELRSSRVLSGSGLRLVNAEHANNDNESDEEAEQVATIVRELVEGGSSWIGPDGLERRLTWDDVLVVAPYNAQVGAITGILPAEARVGTVDKFQGQQAPISIYSMTTSTPEDAPRGMDFLYSRHRLNVATSRARCVAVVVATPALFRVRARSPEQMRLANALCRFAEIAREQSS
jgi:predicted RecB family nuclease